MPRNNIFCLTLTEMRFYRQTKQNFTDFQNKEINTTHFIEQASATQYKSRYSKQMTLINLKKLLL